MCATVYLGTLEMFVIKVKIISLKNDCSLFKVIHVYVKYTQIKVQIQSFKMKDVCLCQVLCYIHFKKFIHDSD